MGGIGLSQKLHLFQMLQVLRCHIVVGIRPLWKAGSEPYLHQILLHGVASGRTARGDLNFPIDGFQVGVDGAGTDHQVFSYLRVGESLSDQAQHFDFAGRQPIGESYR
jgi:hypothetical protein